MEADKNFFPELNLGIVDGIREIGRKAIGLCTYHPPEIAPAISCPDEVPPPDEQLVLFEAGE